MLTRMMEGIMRRRTLGLMELIGDWLPREGPVLDLGSGTGHLAAHIERTRSIEVVTADVSDFHVTGRPPVVVSDAPLPFEDRAFSAALLAFMLAYPRDPASVLSEAARVTRGGGTVIVVQTLSAGPIGRGWHRARELAWTYVAFHVSRLIGYVPRRSRFSMSTRRFYDPRQLEQEIRRAGLRVRARKDHSVLPGGAIVVAALCLERDD
jgi:ubiquinone/menaquinone biosynthesis C-methylase UbiE